MEFVEFIRVRRSLLWHAGILLVVVLGIMALGQHSSININGGGASTRLTSGMGVPAGLLATIAAFFAAIYASSAGTSLNRESTTRDISWTKPVSRTMLALRFILIDLGGVIVAFVLAFAGIFAVFVHMQIAPSFGAQSGMQLVLGAGIGAMWYGLLQMLTCALPPGGRALAGILWPVALLLEGLRQLGGSFGAVVRSIDLINPMLYISYMTDGPGKANGSLVAGLPIETCALLVWFFALLFCAIAIVLWPRREA